MRYILLLSSINFGTEISKRLLLRGPDGHWGSRHYTVRLFILCGYIFSEYVMKRKNSINQPNATSVTFLLIMQGFWAHTLQDSKTALISQFWSVMVLSVGSLMPSGMQSHMGFIVTSFTWYVMGQVLQSIEGLKTSWLWLSNTYFMETLTISILHISSSTSSSVTSPNTTSTITSTNLEKTISKQMFIQSFRLSEWFVTLSTWCNFSPVWMSKWVLMLPVCQNALLHSVQLCGFSPLWLSMCLFKLSASLHDTSRWPHMYTGEASPQCKWVNDFSDVHNPEQFFALSASVWLSPNCERSCASSYLQHN